MMNTTCIMCPMGCALTIEETEGVLTVTGNGCPRGDKYGRAEYSHPERVVTTLLKGLYGGVVSVKTDRPIPKDKIKDLLAWAASYRLDHAVETGAVIAENVADTGANIVATSGFKG
ncbi:MAG: DUF1667 domain-containing protein [Clostridia bacterium]|nr:DUF1667 domain-containing protein [Clostridia bacterium]